MLRPLSTHLEARHRLGGLLASKAKNILHKYFHSEVGFIQVHQVDAQGMLLLFKISNPLVNEVQTSNPKVLFGTCNIFVRQIHKKCIH